MRERADDQKTDNGPLQEDQKQLPQVDRKLGTEDQSADFVKKKHLRIIRFSSRRQQQSRLVMSRDIFLRRLVF